jgi:hypothetical protein
VTEASPRALRRSTDAIARQLCSMHFTDGFCEPRANPDCRCNKLAEGCISAMKTVGVVPVWLHEPTAPVETPSSPV